MRNARMSAVRTQSACRMNSARLLDRVHCGKQLQPANHATYACTIQVFSITPASTDHPNACLRGTNILY